MHIMHAKQLLSIMLLLAIYSTAYCGDKNSLNAKARLLKLNINKLHDFVTSIFDANSKVRLNTDELVFAQIDEEVVVEFIDGDITQKLDCDVISVTRDKKKYFLDIKSQPMTYDTMLSTVKKGCQLLRLEDKKFNNWITSSEYKEIGAACLLSNASKENGRSIEIRSSFNKDKPWVIIYSANFSK